MVGGVEGKKTQKWVFRGFPERWEFGEFWEGERQIRVWGRTEGGFYGSGMVKTDAETIMEATSTAHFSGLHFDDEYPVPKYKGANKVPFVIGELGDKNLNKTKNLCFWYSW